MPVTRSRTTGRSGLSLANTGNTVKRKSPGQTAIDKALAGTSQTIQEFEAIYSGYYEDFQPQGQLESRLVTDIATAHWHALLMQCAETEIFNAHLATTGNAPGTLGYAMQTPAIRAIGLYEERCNNRIDRGSAMLRKLQAFRKQVTNRPVKGHKS